MQKEYRAHLSRARGAPAQGLFANFSGPGHFLRFLMWIKESDAMQGDNQTANRSGDVG